MNSLHLYFLEEHEEKIAFAVKVEGGWMEFSENRLSRFAPASYHDKHIKYISEQQRH